MKKMITPVKGTRDFYPAKMGQRNWLLAKIRRVSQDFGYQEWDGPFLEKIELYAAKSGEELVREQAFVFNDRGGDPVTLRPELTPTLARMVAQQQNELIYPLRWWSFGPFWRYERPQKGRTREFFQWNIDMIGSSSPQSDAELIAVAAQFIRSCGLQPGQVQLLVNDRKLVNQQLERIGIARELHREVFGLIDRKDKLALEAWRELAGGKGFSAADIEAIENLIQDEDAWKQSQDLDTVFQTLQFMGLQEYVRYSPSVIRGLDYYTGIVFEAVDVDGGRAILGGGRYENLVSDVGGDPVSACGFAMGDVMIGVVLEKYGLLPSETEAPADVLVTVFDENSWQSSQEIAAKLRNNGVRTILFPENAKLAKQVKFADRYGIPWLVVCGPEERSRGSLVVRNLRERSQEELPIAAAVELLKNKID